MNKNQYSNIVMNRSMETFLEENLGIVKEQPIFYTHYQEYKLNMTDMESTLVRLALNKKGITDNKKSVRLMLEDKTITMAGIVAAIALEKGDWELYKRVLCTASFFSNKRDDKLITFSVNLVDETKGLQPELAAHSIPQEKTTVYENLVAEFKAKHNAPHIASRSNKVLGEELKMQLRKNRFIHTKQLRPLIRLFKDNHPEFYARYLNLLRLRQPQTSHSQAAGFITDKATGKALHGVVIKTEGAAWITTSNRNGKYKLVIPEAGFYTIIFEKEGYQPVRITEAEIRVGRTLELEIVMIPL